MGKTARWPVSHEKRLRELVAGGIGDTAIARVLNHLFGTKHTKDSVIGKRHRLKLKIPKERQPEEKRTAKRVLPHGHRPQRIEKPTVKLLPKKARKIASVICEGGPHVPGIPLISRARHQCGWPLNEGGPYLFCGMPRAEGFPYCQYHAWLSQRPARRKAAA